jgi:hypothetical protein
MSTPNLDLNDIDRRRAQAYREVPRLRQQALEAAVGMLVNGLAVALERAAQALRRSAGAPGRDLAVRP